MRRLSLVMCLCFTLAGKSLAAPEAPTLKLAHAPALATNVLAHPPWVRVAQFSHDGKRLLSTSETTIRIWDLATGKMLHEFQGNKRWMYGARLSPDGTMIAAFGGWNGEDSVLRCLDARTGKELYARTDHKGCCETAWFSSGGNRLVSSGVWDHSIRVWEPKTGRLIRAMTDKLRIASRIAIPADGKTAVSTPDSDYPGWTVWNLDTGKILRTFEFPGTVYSELAMSRDGRLAAIRGSRVESDKKYSFIAWDTLSGEIRTRYHGQHSWPTSIEFSPKADTVLSASHADLVLWETATGRILRRASHTNEWINGSHFSPDGKLAASAYSSGFIRIHDVSLDKTETATIAEPRIVTALAVSPDGKTAFAGTPTGAIRCVDPASGKQTAVLNRHESPIRSLTVSPDGRHLLSAARTGTPAICCWDLNSARTLHELEVGDEETACAKFSPNGTRIISSHHGTNSSIRVWDIKTGELLERVTPELGEDHMLDVIAMGNVANIAYATHHSTLLRPLDLETGQWIDPKERARRFTGAVIAADSTVALALRLGSATNLGSQLFLYRLPSPPSVSGRQLQEWTREIGHARFRVREHATRGLEEAGWIATRWVKPLVNSDDPEIMHRARRILRATGPLSVVPRRIPYLQLGWFLGSVEDVNTSCGRWAALRVDRPSGTVNGMMIGSFNAPRHELEMLTQIDDNGDLCRLCLLPNGRGVIAGYRDGTIKRHLLK